MIKVVLIAVLLLAGCYEYTYVVCPNNIDKCLKHQLPEGSSVVDIDSSNMERGIYKVKYR